MLSGRLSRDFPSPSPPGAGAVNPPYHLAKATPPEMTSQGGVTSSPSSAVKQETDNCDVDVEQCSDNEGEGGSNKRGDDPDPKGGSKEDNGGEGSKKAKRKEKEKVKIMKSKCNCEELRYVDCYLETKELWDKFNELGTEMIITKTGR